MNTDKAVRGNPWVRGGAIPRGPAAVLAALHLVEPQVDALAGLTDAEWREALDYCDRSRLTFALNAAASAVMPAWVRTRIDRSAKRNSEREARIAELYRALHGSLNDAEIEFVALKGLTHSGIALDPPPRVQYDIDLFVPPPEVRRAQELLISRGW